VTDSDFIPPTGNHWPTPDRSRGWAFCDNPGCLLCATRSPRRDASPALNPGIDGFVAAYKASVERDAESIRAGLRAPGHAVITDGPRRTRRRLRIYTGIRTGVWIGAYVTEDAIYICPLPCVVIRWTR
jgi:hypothetical protein